MFSAEFAADGTAAYPGTSPVAWPKAPRQQGPTDPTVTAIYVTILHGSQTLSLRGGGMQTSPI
jgi:hypothetical protein